MATMNLRKTEDGSVVLPLSKETLEELALTSDSSVDVTIRGGQLVMQAEKRVQSESIFERALAEFHLMPRDPEEDKIWIDAPRVGREML